MVDQGYLNKEVDWNWVMSVMPFMEDGAIIDDLNRKYTGNNCPCFATSGPITDPTTNLYKVSRTIVPGLICPSPRYRISVRF
jgi:hypothetical protein